MDAATVQFIHTLWNSALTLFLTAIGAIVWWIFKRIVEQLDDKPDRDEIEAIQKDRTERRTDVLKRLDEKAAQRELDDLKKDIREWRALNDQRWAELLQEHGRLMGMLEDYKKKNGYRDRR